MSFGGTDRYASEIDVPPLVAAAVEAAMRIGFELCVHPATGRLLQVLAAGVPAGGVIAETGTGTGAGPATGSPTPSYSQPRYESPLTWPSWSVGARLTSGVVARA